MPQRSTCGARCPRRGVEAPQPVTSGGGAGRVAHHHVHGHTGGGGEASAGDRPRPRDRVTRLVCDVGAGIEASVVRIDDVDAEVISTSRTNTPAAAASTRPLPSGTSRCRSANPHRPGTKRRCSPASDQTRSWLPGRRRRRCRLRMLVVMPAVDGGLPVVFTTDALRQVAMPVIVEAVEVVREAIAARGSAGRPDCGGLLCGRRCPDAVVHRRAPRGGHRPGDRGR